jgi:molybdopterin converting factor small subunit
MKIRVVISGRSYDAATEMPEEMSFADGASVDDVIRAITEMLPEGKTLPASCLVAVSGRHLGTLGNHREHALVDGDELVLIAPVAGG